MMLSRHRYLAILALAIVAIIAAGFLAAGLLPSFAATMAESRLRALGFTHAEVKITQIGLSRLEASPVRLKADAGSTTIDRVTVNYDLADLIRDRRIGHVTIDGIDARLDTAARGPEDSALAFDPRALLSGGGESGPGIAIDRIDITQARLNAETAFGPVSARIDGQGRVAADGGIFAQATIAATHRDATLDAQLDASGNNLSLAGAVQLNGLHLPETTRGGDGWQIDGEVAFDGRAPLTSAGLAAPTVRLTIDLSARSGSQAVVTATGSLLATGDSQAIVVRAASPLALVMKTAADDRIYLDLDNRGEDGPPLATLNLDEGGPRVQWSATVAARADQPRLSATGQTSGDVHLGNKNAAPFIQTAQLTLNGTVAPADGIEIAALSLDADAQGTPDRLSGRFRATLSPPDGIAGLAWRQTRPMAINARYQLTPEYITAFLLDCTALPALTFRTDDIRLNLDAARLCPSGDAPAVSANLNDSGSITAHARISSGRGVVTARRAGASDMVADGTFPDLDVVLDHAPQGGGWTLSATAQGGVFDLNAAAQTVRTSDLVARVVVKSNGTGAVPTIRTDVERIILADQGRIPVIVPIVAAGQAELDGRRRVRFALTARDEGNQCQG